MKSFRNVFEGSQDSETAARGWFLVRFSISSAKKVSQIALFRHFSRRLFLVIYTLDRKITQYVTSVYAMINKTERERDMMRFQNAIATQIWLDWFDTPPDIIG